MLELYLKRGKGHPETVGMQAWYGDCGGTYKLKQCRRQACGGNETTMVGRVSNKDLKEADGAEWSIVVRIQEPVKW